MYWNILVWLRIEIPDGFLHQISKNLKIDDLVTGGTINLQLTLQLDSAQEQMICERIMHVRIVRPVYLRDFMNDE